MRKPDATRWHGLSVAPTVIAEAGLVRLAEADGADWSSHGCSGPRSSVKVRRLYTKGQGR
ncbi:hypothetical protein I553_4880 [Mycobacterium xenopi 4042]|uniref:Uncharacterized protein n=1 Tax=Mycobacterium xenopi 4042 TaxID=1299334 RepID=X8AHW6_MYCXE|nr:hypothetical protein I553_4880 [Mycobacterium xenopi 4042]